MYEDDEDYDNVPTHADVSKQIQTKLVAIVDACLLENNRLLQVEDDEEIVKAVYAKLGIANLQMNEATKKMQRVALNQGPRAQELEKVVEALKGELKKKIAIVEDFKSQLKELKEEAQHDQELKEKQQAKMEELGRLLTNLSNACENKDRQGGGHTAEMLNVIDFLDKQRFYPRVYIAALTDNMSLSRAATMEERVGTSSALHKGDIRYIQIYRSREVGQSYLTSVLTTIIATFHGLWLVFSVRPDIVCNQEGRHIQN
ncbi:hypothetical protein L7F22_003836 [Adiantum nelumboides]|nr:hypothetical protein [Adiantum nelumboides]